MDLAGIVGVAAGLAGVMGTSLELERRVTNYHLGMRGDRLRARAGELAKFLQTLTQLPQGGADEQLAQEAISSTKTDLNNVLKELVRSQRLTSRAGVDEMAPIRRWLLLFVPARRFAWILHLGFYFTVWLVILFGVEFKAVVASHLLPVKTVVGGICFLAALAALLRYWAVMEMRWAEGFRPSPSPMRRTVLWYKPASRREMIARAGILFGLAQFVPFFSALWISGFRQILTLAEITVALITFYACEQC